MRDHTKWLSKVEKVIGDDPIASSRAHEIWLLEDMAKYEREAARLVRQYGIGDGDAAIRSAIEKETRAAVLRAEQD